MALIDVFSRERQEHIVRIVDGQSRARVADLSVRLRVSQQTIRKDLAALATQGRLIRAHGGAMAAGRAKQERAFDVRERLQQDEKSAIGRSAAALIEDGQSIALDASTTSLCLARAIKARAGWTQLTVVTNGLRTASELAGYPGITVAMPGGRVRWEALSLVGSIGEGVFERINLQTAFVGAGGFTIDTGLSDMTEEEAQIKRSMTANAREIVALVDHTKWGSTAFATFCPTDQLDRVVTDEQAPPDMVRGLRERDVEVLVVEAELRINPARPVSRTRKEDEPIVMSDATKPSA